VASNAGVVGKNRLDQYLAIGSMTPAVRATVATVDRGVYRTDCHTSVNLVYHSLQHGDHNEQNRTEQNLIVLRRKSEAKVTNNGRLCSA